jgi:hypothetical protein
MKGNRKYWQRLVAVIVVVGGLVTGGAPPSALGEGVQSLVVPRNTSSFGNTYGEWSARWWQWILSIPEDINPGFDTTGANCDEGQAGPVWFLAGTFTGGNVTRTCTIPAGKALLFAIWTGLFGSGVFDCDPTVPGVLCNMNALRIASIGSMDQVTLRARLDGMPIRNLRGQRVSSTELTLTIPENNFLDIDPGTYTPQVSDGYWVLLKPLSPGEHILSFGGSITGGPFEGQSYELTYHLTIQ